MSDLSTAQLDIMRELNEVLMDVRDNTRAIADNMGALGAQSQSFAQLNSSAAAAADSINGMGAAAQSALTPIDALYNRVKNLYKSVTDGFKSVVKSVIGETGLVALSTAWELLKTNVASLTDSLTGPAAAAFGFLGTIYDTLIEKASALAEAQTQYAEALENIREKYGSFYEATSGTIKRTAESLTRALDVASAGSGAFRSKFAPGIEGAIQRLQVMDDIVADLGATFDGLGKESVASASAELFVLKKGLNFSTEAMKQTAVLAQLAGKGLRTFSNEIMASVDKIGRNFGISTKVLGQDVGRALSNFRLLGKMTGDYAKQMTSAAVYTRKLGIEINELTSLIDKFDEFESGAEAAASLAQGFGLVLDPLRMMNMEVGPRLQEMQRAFVATGRTIDNMSRQERKLLADTAGLTEQQALLAFSQKGLSMSYDEISRGADSAMKRQKSTDEVMSDLADNIRNFIMPFQQVKGFIDAFIKGIGVGLGLGRDFMDVISGLAKGLKLSYNIGISVGKMFSSMFFGSTQLKSFAISWSDMFTNIFGSIRSFVSGLQGGGEFDIASGVTTMLRRTFAQLDMIGSAISNIDFADNILDFGRKLLLAISGALDWIQDDGIDRLSIFFSEMFNETGKSSSIISGFGEALLKVFDPNRVSALINGMSTLVPQIAAAIGRLFEKYPWAAWGASLITAGGPLITAVLGVIRGIVGQVSGALGDVSKTLGESLGPSTLPASLGGSVAAAATSNARAGAAAVITNSQSFIERLANVLEDPAKITAMAAAVAGSIKILGISIMDTTLAFMDPLPGRTESFIDVVVSSANKMKSLKLTDLLTLGAILGAVGLGVAGAIAAVSTLSQKISAEGAALALAASVTFGGALLFGQAGIKSGLSIMLGTVSDVIADFGDFVSNPTLISNVSKISSNVSVAEGLNRVGELAGSLFKGVSALFNSLPRGFFGGIDVDGIKNDILALKEILVGGGQDNIFSVILSIDLRSFNAATATASAANITAAAAVFKSVETLISSMPGEESILYLKNSFKALNDEGFVSGFQSFATNPLFSMTPIDAGVASIFFNSSQILLQRLKILSDISAAAGGADAYISLAAATNEIPNTLDSMSAALQAIKIASASAIINDNLQPQNLAAPLQDFMNAISRSTLQLSAEGLTNLEMTLVAISDRVVTIRRILEDLPAIDLNGTIDKISNNMSIAKKTLEINGGAVKIQVNMNVTMNAAKLAGELVMDGFVTGTPEFDAYLQNPDNNRTTYEYTKNDKLNYYDLTTGKLFHR